MGSQCYCILLYIFVYRIYTIWCLINSVRSKQCPVCVFAVFFKSSKVQTSVSLFTSIFTILTSRPSYKICICLGGRTFKGVILGFIHVMYCTFFCGFCFSLICNSLLKYVHEMQVDLIVGNVFTSAFYVGFI